MAWAISIKGPKNVFLLALKAASSSGVGGISGVLVIDHNTDDIEQITKNLQEVKNKYPELTSINKLWWDVLRRWSNKLHDKD